MKENEKKQIQLTCDIVGDLLPLYHDDVVSEDTREAVGRHLAACEKCLKEYEILKEKIPETDGNEEEGKKENQTRSFLKKVRKQGVLKGVIAAVIAVAFLAGMGYVLTEVPLIEASAKSVSVEHVFEEEGNFFIVCKTPRYKNCTATYTDYDENKVYITYKIPVIHFKFDDEEEMKIIALEKKDLEENSCKAERLLYNGKEIYRAGDVKNEKEAPEYVKVYFEYSNSGKGMMTSLSVNTITLAIVEDEGAGDEDEKLTGYKQWDWDGNLIYEEDE